MWCVSLPFLELLDDPAGPSSAPSSPHLATSITALKAKNHVGLVSSQ